MLAMSNSVQSFIDAHVKAQTDEFACFMSQQVEKMIEDDPTGARADAYISYWYDTKRTPLATGDKLRIKFSAQVLKTLTMRRYVEVSKRLNYWELVTQYHQGTDWQKQVAYGEIAYRVRKVATEPEFIEWLQTLLNLEPGEEINYLLQTPEQFITLTR